LTVFASSTQPPLDSFGIVCSDYGSDIPTSMLNNIRGIFPQEAEGALD
jgi:hypothetical protein